MSISTEKQRLIKEIDLIPEEKLSEIYDFIHFFRLGLEVSQKREKSIMDFAGCWADMPPQIYNEFSRDIIKRRRQSFSRRRDGETNFD